MTKREKLAPKDFIGKREWQHDDSKVSENMNGNKIAGVSNNQTYWDEADDSLMENATSFEGGYTRSMRFKTTSLLLYNN